MSTKNKLNRVVWAVDAFAEDEALQINTAKMLKALTRGGPLTIEPVSIVHWQDRFTIDRPVKNLEEIQELARVRLTRLLEKVRLEGATPPTILAQNDLSLTEAVLRIVNHAKANGTDLIAVSTLAKKGTTRFLLGSFAETLILESDLPSLVVSPRAAIPRKIRSILFPTDLTPRSLEAFEEVVGFAATLGARVVIFHRTDLQSSQGIEPFRTIAANRGVETVIEIQATPMPTAKAILKAGKDQGTDVIAMVSNRGPGVSRVIIGSITRRIVREALCPVWVVHPK